MLLHYILLFLLLLLLLLGAFCARDDEIRSFHVRFPFSSFLYLSLSVSFLRTFIIQLPFPIESKVFSDSNAYMTRIYWRSFFTFSAVNSFFLLLILMYSSFIDIAIQFFGVYSDKFDV